MAADPFKAFPATERRRLRQLFALEEQAHAQGFARVAGVDEAGRGALAGPLVAAAVVLDGPVAGLNDSKLLTAARRDALYETVMAGGHAVGVCAVSHEEIDTVGIQQANYMAMVRAAGQLEPPPGLLLIDGFTVPGTALPQWRVVKGDRRSLSIAAASVVAKVTRDRMMCEFDREYPQYEFGRHKGYATEQHLSLLARHGASPIHRRSFAPLAQRAEPGMLFPPEDESTGRRGELICD